MPVQLNYRHISATKDMNSDQRYINVFFKMTTEEAQEMLDAYEEGKPKEGKLEIYPAVDMLEDVENKLEELRAKDKLPVNE